MVALEVRVVRIVLSLASIVGLQACTDRPTEPVASLNAPRPTGSATRLECVADVRAAKISCAAPKPKANSDAIVLGGQGTYVQISAANVSYDGTSVFQADLTVQNLTAQQLGTTTGADTTGVRVFINSGPFGTGGTVTTIGDSVGMLTAADQHYIVYKQILDAFGGMSSPQTWRFNVPNTVPFFVFTVLVSANVPDQAGVLRWDVERGFAGYSNQFVWGTDSRNVFAFGNDGTAFTLDRFDGAAWHSINRDFPVDVRAAWSASASDVWVAGANGAVYHYDGTTWSNRSPPTENTVTGIWGTSPTDIWIVSGGSIRHYDGSVWGSPVGISGNYQAISGAAADNVFAVGDIGVVAHFDGMSWASQTVPLAAQSFYLQGVYAAGSEVWAVGDVGSLHYSNGNWAVITDFGNPSFTAVHGSSATNVWATGSQSQGDIYHHVIRRWTDSVWSTIVSQDAVGFASIWTSGPNDAWAVGQTIDYETDGVPYHWNGISFTAVGSYAGILERGVQSLNATFGASASDVWAVGTSGLILRNTGNGWQQVGTREPNINWNGIWGSAATDIWIVGDGGQIRHWDGMNLTVSPSPPNVAGETLAGVYGFAADNVYAVGRNGSIIHFGATWTFVVNVEYGLNAIWGSDANNIWAVGQNSTIFHSSDGTTWPEQPNPSGFELFAIRGGPSTTSVPDLFAVGEHGTILRYSDATWIPVTSPTAANLMGLFTDGPSNHMLAVGTRGTLLRYTGSQWVSAASGVSSDIHGVWMSALDNIFTVGVGEFIAHGHH
jgi:hypothetical protein